MRPTREQLIARGELPAWVTASQWRLVPDVQWWKDSEARAEYLRQLPPVSSDEFRARIARNKERLRAMGEM